MKAENYLKQFLLKKKVLLCKKTILFVKWYINMVAILKPYNIEVYYVSKKDN